MQLRLVESGFSGGKRGAGTAGIKLEPDLVSLVVDVPGGVQRVSALVRKNVFLAADFALPFIC